MASYSQAIELAEEIRSLIQSDDLSRAAIRLLDYAKQFAKQREINSAILLLRELRGLHRDSRTLGKSSDYHIQLNELANRIMETLDAFHHTGNRPVAESTNLLPLSELPDTTILEEPHRVDKPNSGKEAISKVHLTKREQDQEDFIQARKKTRSLPTAVLEASGLQKTYHGGFTLSAINLTLRPGEITGLLGVNGSGKSTLLRVLAGELASDRGDLAYPLLCPNSLDWVRIRSQIAFVPQRPPRWHGILEENLYLHAALRQLTGRANEDEVEFILHRLGLETYRKARWAEISGGFQMRFELAKALIGRPKLLILDEPLAPLDINTQQVFLQDLRDIANSSLAPLPIILSSQHIYEVEAIADWILFLDNGKVVFSGALDKLYQERQESTYEITSPAEKAMLLEHLEPLGVIDIEHTGLTYIVSVPPEITSRRVLDCLFKANVEVKYFRDISSSSRKLFKGRGE